MYQQTSGELGGPGIMGGTFTVDSSAMILTFVPVCSTFGGRPSHDGFPPFIKESYSYDPATRTLTMFANPNGTFEQPTEIYQRVP